MHKPASFSWPYRSKIYFLYEFFMTIKNGVGQPSLQPLIHSLSLPLLMPARNACRKRGFAA
jgi:hypothetical protein